MRWQGLLASSPVCIAQTGRKWPSQFGVDIKSVLQQSADCGFPQSIFCWGVFVSGWSIFDFFWCLFELPTLVNQFAPPLLGMYICVVTLSWGVAI